MHDASESAHDLKIERGDRNFGLDLLRSLAITLVIVSHYGGVATWAFLHAYPLFIYLPGYFGVELFFALSGFLIGGILLKIVAQGAAWRSLRIFWVRRWMRTLPAYFVVLAILFPFGVRAYPLTWPEILSYLTLSQNLAWRMPNNFFFAVTWSLTVEEWFYLLFGAAFLGAGVLFKGRARVAALAAVVGLFLAAPLLARIGMPAKADWDDSIRKIAALRLDAIVYGVLAILIYRSGFAARLYGVMALIGAAMTVGLFLAWDFSIGVWSFKIAWLRPTIFNISSIGFALMLPWFTTLGPGKGAFGALVRWVSSRSYSLYLTHFEILRWSGYERHKHMSSALWTGLAALAVCLVASELLHRFVERPFMRLRPSQPIAPASPKDAHPVSAAPLAAI